MKISKFEYPKNHAVGIDVHIVDMLRSKLNYIRNNRAKEGIIENAVDYVYSSAGDYVGKTGLVKVDLLVG